MTATSARASVVTAAILDVVFVFAFAAIGRVSHGESLAGIAITFWPFLVGLAIGWLVTRGWNRPYSVLRTGLGVWLSTVVIGMLLRLATAQGIAFSFVVVATIVLAVFLLGWRGIALLVVRLRRAR